MIGTAIVTGLTLLVCVVMCVKDSIKRLRNSIKEGRKRLVIMKANFLEYYINVFEGI